MGPWLRATWVTVSRLPRTRGDGPKQTVTQKGTTTVAPHTRGWARLYVGACPVPEGCPAHAGMGPCPSPRRCFWPRLPRTRGDGPLPSRQAMKSSGVAPHTRGWALIGDLDTLITRGCPAHAGMGPPSLATWQKLHRLPRTRGDGPITTNHVVCGQGVAPHTRGWALLHLQSPPPFLGCPAHAGMGLNKPSTVGTDTWLPRTRGDGPHAIYTPDEARMVAPHTRGWALERVQALKRSMGCPAHAGMGPAQTAGLQAIHRLPRTRGDGPPKESTRHVASLVAPHTRGWAQSASKQGVCKHGCPAHAGIGPHAQCIRQGSAWLPRTRGDRPPKKLGAACCCTVAPHTRG